MTFSSYTCHLLLDGVQTEDQLFELISSFSRSLRNEIIARGRFEGDTFILNDDESHQTSAFFQSEEDISLPRVEITQDEVEDIERISSLVKAHIRDPERGEAGTMITIYDETIFDDEIRGMTWCLTSFLFDFCTSPYFVISSYAKEKQETFTHQWFGYLSDGAVTVEYRDDFISKLLSCLPNGVHPLASHHQEGN